MAGGAALAYLSADDSRRRPDAPSPSNATPSSPSKASQGKAAAGGGGELMAAAKTPPFPLVTALRACSGWVLFASMESLPLWMIGSRTAGGMQLAKEQVGLMLSLATGCIWLWSTFAQGKVIGKLGFRRALLGGGLGASVGLVLMPALGALSMWTETALMTRLQ